MQADLVIRNASQVLTLDPGHRGADPEPAGLGLIRDGAVAVMSRSISWVGRDADLEAEVSLTPAGRVIDAGGGVIMPGLVDPHTHVVFAGSRHAEFALRLKE